MSDVVWMPGGVRTEIQLTGADTDGAFCLLADQPPTGWSLPPHRHLAEAETMHIVEGRFEVEVDGELRVAEAGDTLHVPKGVVHATRGSGRRVVVFSPAGIEAFFLEVGQPTPDEETDVDAALAAAQRHGWRFGR